MVKQPVDQHGLINLYNFHVYYVYIYFTADFSLAFAVAQQDICVMDSF